MSIRILPLDERTVGDAAALLRRVQRLPVDAAFLLAKYEPSLFGGTLWGRVAYAEDGTAVGFMGVSGYRFLWGDRVVVGGQMCDAFTHPQYRGRGIFDRLGRAIMAESRQRGVAFLYCFANQSSLPLVTRRWQWPIAHRLKCFPIPLHGLHYERVLRRIGFSGGLYARWRRRLFRPLGEAERCFQGSLARDGKPRVLRDRRHFEYKSFGGNTVIRRRGVRVWLKTGGMLTLGDMEPCDPEIFAAVLGDLLRLGRRLGLPQLAVQSSPGTFLDRVLSPDYQSIDTLAVGFYNIEEFPWKDCTFTFADVDTF